MKWNIFYCNLIRAKKYKDEIETLAIHNVCIYLLNNIVCIYLLIIRKQTNNFNFKANKLEIYTQPFTPHWKGFWGLGWRGFRFALVAAGGMEAQAGVRKQAGRGRGWVGGLSGLVHLDGSPTQTLNARNPETPFWEMKWNSRDEIFSMPCMEQWGRKADIDGAEATIFITIWSLFQENVVSGTLMDFIEALIIGLLEIGVILHLDIWRQFIQPCPRKRNLHTQ